MKRGDFVRIDYTGKVEGETFDSTDEPVAVCVGERMILPGLDEALEKHEEDFTVTLQPEQAFGKKDPKLLRVIPTQQLQQQGITPQPGMQLNVDGNYGVVKRTGGGRTVVDFNHPLAGREVTYDVAIRGNVTDAKEQIGALLRPLGIEHDSIAVEKDAAVIKLQRMLPQQVLDQLQERITKCTGVKTVSFEAGEKPEDK